MSLVGAPRQRQAVRAKLALEQIEDAIEDVAATLAGELAECERKRTAMSAQLVTPLRVERSRGSDPDALEVEERVLGDPIEVLVVVEHCEVVLPRDRGDTAS